MPICLTLLKLLISHDLSNILILLKHAYLFATGNISIRSLTMMLTLLKDAFIRVSIPVPHLRKATELTFVKVAVILRSIPCKELTIPMTQAVFPATFIEPFSC